MTTDYVTVKGYIKDGQLNVALPENVADGEVEVQVPVILADALVPADIPWEERPWTEEELIELFDAHPTALGEMLESGLIGAGANDWVQVDDSADFVQRLRRDEQTRRRRWMDR
jgi:hypothetical protein